MITTSELDEACQTIRYCTLTQAREIMDTLLKHHAVIMVNIDTSRLDVVASCHLNGSAIQINVE